jgi:hypothetical protein
VRIAGEQPRTNGRYRMGAAGKRIPERHDRPAFLAIATRLIRPGERRPARAKPPASGEI